MKRTLVLMLFICNIWLQNSFAQFMYLSKIDPYVALYQVSYIQKITFKGNKMNLKLSNTLNDIEAINNIRKITFSDVVGVGIADISTEDNIQIRAYPNPANEKVTIEFSLKVSGKIELKIYNMAGILVNYFNQDYLPAGIYSYPWNLTDIAKNSVPNGIYMCQLRTPEKIVTSKIIIIK